MVSADNGNEGVIKKNEMETSLMVQWLGPPRSSGTDRKMLSGSYILWSKDSYKVTRTVWPFHVKADWLCAFMCDCTSNIHHRAYRCLLVRCQVIFVPFCFISTCYNEHI